MNNLRWTRSGLGQESEVFSNDLNARSEIMLRINALEPSFVAILLNKYLEEKQIANLGEG